jgi:UDP-2,3-diacylglucosamine hydrolase
MKYFVSDFHFGANARVDNLTFSRFETFCNSLLEGDELYILGDFFDFWIEYKTVARSDYVEIYFVLLDTKKRGVKIFLFRGNHDFFRGDFLKKFSAEIFDKDVKFEQNGKVFFCTHGDEIKNDSAYSIIRFIFRNAFFQFLYKLLHPDFAVYLANLFSKLSQKKNAEKVKSEERKERYRKCAFEFLSKKNCDILIAGHSHICDLVKSGDKIYANSGVWFEKPTYILLDEKKLFLKEFCGDLQKDIILEEKEI